MSKNDTFFSRIAEALLAEYTSIYYVDAITNEYRWYSTDTNFHALKIPQEGRDFFYDLEKDVETVVYAEDRSRLLKELNRDKLKRDMKQGSMQSIRYRLMINGQPVYHELRLIRGSGKLDEYYILGVLNVDKQVRQTQEIKRNLESSNKMARRDELTGVHNSHAFKEMKQLIQSRMDDTSDQISFAVVVCDVNDLKLINDTRGQGVGDEYLQKAGSLICETFSHSPVYRIGGDEFATVLTDRDYDNRVTLMEKLRACVIQNGLSRSGPVIATGIAKYNPEFDLEFVDVLERADREMYENKIELKDLRRRDGFTGLDVQEEIPEGLRRRLDSLFDAIYSVYDEGYIFLCDMKYDFSRWSVQAVTDFLLPSPYMYAAGNIWKSYIHPEDVGIYQDAVDQVFLSNGSLKKIRYRAKKADGEYVTCSTRGFILCDDDGKAEYFGGVIVTDAVLRKDHFFTDPVTGLPNTNYLYDHFNEREDWIRNMGGEPVLIYFDINAMQYYNNQYGYSRGDELLCLTANVLTESFPGALICRAMDDHFILIDEFHSREQLAERLVSANDRIKATAYGNTTGFQAGICIYGADMHTGEAMDHAKHAVRWIDMDLNAVYHFYSDEIDMEYKSQTYIIDMFDEALKNEWIKVYYHGIVRLETGKGAAFEALARWIDPERGVIAPGFFVPALRKYHLTYKLDLYMFEQICKEIPMRQKAGLPLLPVSVNFSAQDFDYVDIYEEVEKRYEQYGIEACGVGRDYFIIEITEQEMATGTDRFYAQLRQMRKKGYRLWLDDFGSGYSSLNVFSRLEIDLIKFDMDLLLNLDRNGGVNRYIFKSMIDIARKFGVHTLAEGMETDQQKKFLREIGCELAQGFGFHKPEPLDNILPRVKETGIVGPCETEEERKALMEKWNL
ncbi:MAG: EAL domain-containing protein [Lachnospiraceae bacterium]|nr:EAL domain-containing protein [Lachnospiraceae bacterium]